MTKSKYTQVLAGLLLGLLVLGMGQVAHAKKARISRPPWTLRSYLMIDYAMGMPMGPTYDFAKDFSFVGIDIEYRFRLAKLLSIGALIGWQNFEDKINGTFDNGNTTVTGSQIRHLQAMPLCGTVHFYYTKKKMILPYLGVGLGGYYIKRYTDYAWWTNSENTWHFGMFPEIGIVATAKRIPFHFSTRFNYLVETQNAPSEFFWTFNIGVAFAL